MIIQLADDAPFLIKAAAAAALWAHVGGAGVGLASGTVAVLSRKGARLHRQAGTVFFASMLVMSATGAVTAPFLPDRVSALMGVFTFYLTATAWAAVKRPPGRTGRFEPAAAVVAGALVAAYGWLALVGAASPRGLVDGQQPFQLAIVFAAMAALAAAMDVRVVRLGGLAGPQRIARHLWRMCLALVIAWGSFAGQPKAQPEALRGSPVLVLPALVTLGLLAWWLWRVRPRRRAGRAAGPSPIGEAIP